MTSRTHLGFTLVEALIAVAITGLLLASVAVAMHASLTSYAANDRVTAVTQAARSILYKMEAQVRTAASMATAANSLSITDGGGKTEQYDLVNGQLTYRTSDGQVAVLLGPADEVKVTSFVLTPEFLLDAQGHNVVDAYGRNALKSLTCRLTFICGDQTMAVTTSAAVRRNQTY